MPMDLEEKKKRQTLKVLLVEAFMTVAVVVTVVVLVLVVSGYRINSDFQIERFGFLRINSVPDGASVIIDGEDTHDKTGYGRVISSNEHEIVLEKEGYDSWKKTVKISEGLLYQVRYPRLFLKERVKEHVLDFSEVSFASVSPDYGRMLILDNNEWYSLNLRDEKVAKKSVEISVLKNMEENAKVLDMIWSRNSRRIIVKESINDEVDWLFIDLDNDKNSFSLKKQFETTFEKLTVLDGSANELLAYKNKKLFKIDTSKHLLSDALVSGVEDYYPYIDGGILFMKEKSKEKVNADDGLEKTIEETPADKKEYMIGLLTGSEVKEIKTMDTLARIVAVNFYDDKYLVTYTADSLSVYKGESLNLVMQREIKADLDSLKIESGDGFVVARNGDTINSLDMEAMHLDVWDLNKDDVNLDGFGWLDRGIIYSVLNGKLFVHDFDGQNERELSSDVDGSKPVIITDNKWLYYFSNGALMREWLIKK